MNYCSLNIFLNKFIDDIIHEGQKRKIAIKKSREEVAETKEEVSFDLFEMLTSKVIQ